MSLQNCENKCYFPIHTLTDFTTYHPALFLSQSTPFWSDRIHPLPPLVLFFMLQYSSIAVALMTYPQPDVKMKSEFKSLQKLFSYRRFFDPLSETFERQEWNWLADSPSRALRWPDQLPIFARFPWLSFPQSSWKSRLACQHQGLSWQSSCRFDWGRRCVQQQQLGYLRKLFGRHLRLLSWRTSCHVPPK